MLKNLFFFIFYRRQFYLLLIVNKCTFLNNIDQIYKNILNVDFFQLLKKTSLSYIQIEKEII